ncbi:MAG TPA: Gfo/Idh/MocA family oxidoreductase [Ignavibacteria bacterium]|nr:Gfo/Idh/MocA family oxidoreductase [Ignavibacteria bacterium]
MIKITVIGIGHLGRLHVKNLKEIEKERNDIQITGIFDADSEKLNKAADEFSVKKFDSVDDAIDNSDSIILVTPTTTHFELAKKIIGKDKNIFIEKPVTETIPEADELLKLSKNKKIKIQVGHIERFNPAVLALEKYNLKPLFIETHRLSQFNPRGTDVSVIQDLMIHDIDIILKLVNSPVERIDANGVAILTDKIDIANARIRFKNGCVANITASRISQNKMRKMRVFQKNAYISIDFLQNLSEIFHLEDSDGSEGFSFASFDIGNNKKIVYERATVEDINPMKYELNKFIDSIKNNTEPVVNLEEGKRALEVAEYVIKEVENSLTKITNN